MPAVSTRLALALVGAGFAAALVAAPASAAPATSGGGCTTNSDLGLTACIGPGRHSGHLQGSGQGDPGGAIMWTDVRNASTEQLIGSTQGTVVDVIPPGPGRYVATYYRGDGHGAVSSPVLNYP